MREVEVVGNVGLEREGGVRRCGVGCMRDVVVVINRVISIVIRRMCVCEEIRIVVIDRIRRGKEG